MDEVLREVTRVLEAVAAGDLSARVRVETGDPALAALVRATNRLVERVAAEVRGLAEVTTAVARGELGASLDVEAGGEIAALNQTINTMLDRLRQLADEAARVAAEVGAQARTRAESRVADVAGVWKALTDNLSLAETLALVARTRSELLASMSHELRTPLNSLRILAKLLSDNREANLTATQLEYARTIYGSGGDLLALINEILELARLESGTLRVEPVEVALADVETSLIATFRPVAEQRGLRFTVGHDEAVPARFHTDPRRLEQVLRNLVGNALKFTHAGGVDVRIGRAARGRLTFAVTDSGIGIPAASLERIFQPFRQADASTSKTYGGTGLGLSISRAIADLLGGELRAASTPGMGSTFTLEIPDRPAGAEAATPPKPRAPASPRPVVSDPQLTGRKLLIIDDDMRRVFATIALLEAHGARMLYAERAAAALAVLEQHRDLDAVLSAVPPDGDPAIAELRARFEPIPWITLRDIAAEQLPDAVRRALPPG